MYARNFVVSIRILIRIRYVYIDYNSNVHMKYMYYGVVYMYYVYMEYVYPL